jgi:anti-sigma regulatory factor (Ser/Thr protein kinase)
LSQSVVIPVDGSTRVAEVRRAVLAVAEAEDIEGDAASNSAIVATELASNLFKHATAGEIHIASLSERGQPGVEILSIDRGPGIVDLGQCLVDGYSTAGTAGTGLGAILRLSSEFDAYSEIGRGTVVVSRLYARPGAPASLPPVVAGVVSRPVTNEVVCGDSWAVSFTEAGAIVFVADGLGHGPLAAEASRKAVLAFRQSSDADTVAILQQVHAALQGTRGAAVALAALSYDAATIRFAGIGNIAGRVVGLGTTSQMMSHMGTAGYQARRFQEFAYRLPPSAAVIMHSDGIISSWNLDDYSGLVDRDPALIAAVLYRDGTRGRDDVCVVVVKARGAV